MAKKKRYYKSGFIHEDKNSQANLPQNVKMQNISDGDYLDYMLDDTMVGIDRQMSQEKGAIKANKSKTKY